MDFISRGGPTTVDRGQSGSMTMGVSRMRWHDALGLLSRQALLVASRTVLHYQLAGGDSMELVMTLPH